MKFLMYREKLRELESLQKQIEVLENDPEVVHAQAFLSRLYKLMEDYGMSPEGVRDVLYPPRTPPGTPVGRAIKPEKDSYAAQEQPIHAPRPPAEYHNPYTGEVLRTRDPRNATLKAWRDKYGMSEVVNWKVS